MRLKHRTRLSVLAVAVCLTATGCSGSSDDAGAPGATRDAALGATPSAAATPSTAPDKIAPGRGFTMVATGDVLVHVPVIDQARRDAKTTGAGALDFAPMMAGVKPYVSAADLAICHLEVPLAKRSGPFSGYPSFSSPPQVVKALKTTGYDVCSTASNHTFDKGAAGVKRTLDVLDAEGIRHAGSARTAAESRRVTQLRANGVRVAFLSYTFGFNGNSASGAPLWQRNVIDKSRILRDARRARAAGAQVVVLAMHWGTEYQQTPDAKQQELAPVLARTGAIDLIVSHHAHVVEPVQRIGKTWVVYGLGNMIANHATPGAVNSEGLLTQFTFTKSRGKRFVVTKAEYVPLMMTDRAPLHLLDVREALRTREYGSSSRPRLRAALLRTTRVVKSMDGAKHGLRAATPEQ